MMHVIFRLFSSPLTFPFTDLKHRNGRKTCNLGFMYKLSLNCIETLQRKIELGRKLQRSSIGTSGEHTLISTVIDCFVNLLIH